MPRFFICPNCAKIKKSIPLVTDGDSRVCSSCKSIFQTKSHISDLRKL